LGIGQIPFLHHFQAEWNGRIAQRADPSWKLRL
jgi:hypothetical protein